MGSSKLSEMKSSFAATWSTGGAFSAAAFAFACRIISITSTFFFSSVGAAVPVVSSVQTGLSAVFAGAGAGAGSNTVTTASGLTFTPLSPSSSDMLMTLPTSSSLSCSFSPSAPSPSSVTANPPVTIPGSSSGVFSL